MMLSRILIFIKKVIKSIISSISKDWVIITHILGTFPVSEVVRITSLSSISI